MPTKPSFLADESCDFAIVRALRAAGFTVDAVCELAASSSDEAIIALAASRDQILLTEDKHRRAGVRRESALGWRDPRSVPEP